MRPTLHLALSLALLCSSCATYSKPKHAINAHFGYRSFSDSEFEDVDQHPVYGIEGLLGLTHQGLGLEGGWFPSQEEDSAAGVESSLEVDEFFLGLRNTWNTDDLLQPYLGGGVVYADGSLENLPAGDDGDEFWGAYARAGLALTFALLQVGVDLRGTVTESGLESDASLDNLQATGFVGLTF